MELGVAKPLGMDSADPNQPAIDKNRYLIEA